MPERYKERLEDISIGRNRMEFKVQKAQLVIADVPCIGRNRMEFKAFLCHIQNVYVRTV